MPGPERGTHSCRVGYGRSEQNASPWIWQPPASSGSSSVGPGSSERAVVALFGLRPATLFFTMDALPALFRQARSPRSLLAARLPEMRRSDCEVSRNRGRRGFTERSVPGLKGASEAQRERGVSHAGGPNGPDEPCPELIAAWASSRSPSRPVVRESGAGSAEPAVLESPCSDPGRAHAVGQLRSARESQSRPSSQHSPLQVVDYCPVTAVWKNELTFPRGKFS